MKFYANTHAEEKLEFEADFSMVKYSWNLESSFSVYRSNRVEFV